MTDAESILHGLIIKFEGCRLAAYQCPAGVWTCGYGATGPDIGPGTRWTMEQARDRMVSDASLFLAGASRLCPNADGPRLAALSDFAFNLGLTRLSASTLRKCVISNDWPGAGLEIKKWVRAGGRVLPGLVARRNAEAALLLAD